MVGVHVVVGSSSRGQFGGHYSDSDRPQGRWSLVTGGGTCMRGDKLEITVYNKEIWVEPAISLLPSWPDPDCPGPEGRSHNTNWRLQITISI